MQRSATTRRLDGVRWNRFHTAVALAPGVGWRLEQGHFEEAEQAVRGIDQGCTHWQIPAPSTSAASGDARRGHALGSSARAAMPLA